MDASIDYLRGTVPATESFFTTPTAPAWVLAKYGSPAPDIATDFVNNLHWDVRFGQSSAFNAYSIGNRTGTTIYYADSSGNYSPYTVTQMGLNDLGLNTRTGRSNLIANNSMQGAAVGTPGTAPTLWSINSTSGITSQVVAIGVENGIDYIDIRWSGTPSATNTNTRAIFSPTGVSGIVATSGQVWSGSVFCTLQAGSLTNIVAIGLEIPQFDSGGAFVANVNPSFTPITESLSAGRTTATTAALGATIAFIGMDVNLSVTNGNPIDVTLRFGWPQIEVTAIAGVGWVTAPIRTTSLAATGQIDKVNLVAGMPVLNSVSMYWRGLSLTSANPKFMIIWSGSLANRISFITTTSDLPGSQSAIASVTANAGFNAPDGTFGTNTIGKMACALATGDQAFSFNGQTVRTGVPTGYPPGMNALVVGGDTTAGVDGYTTDSAVWFTRIPNARLQSITT